jgi:hypothetical protein
LPARSDGLDRIDGGPDGADIALKPMFGKLEMPDLRGFKADRALRAWIKSRPSTAC